MLPQAYCSSLSTLDDAHAIFLLSGMLPCSGERVHFALRSAKGVPNMVAAARTYSEI